MPKDNLTLDEDFEDGLTQVYYAWKSVWVVQFSRNGATGEFDRHVVTLTPRESKRVRKAMKKAEKYLAR